MLYLIMGKIYGHELVVSPIKLVLTVKNLHLIVVVYVIKIVFHMFPLIVVNGGPSPSQDSPAHLFNCEDR